MDYMAKRSYSGVSKRWALRALDVLILNCCVTS